MSRPYQQPRTGGGGGGKSPDELAAEIASDLAAKTPALLTDEDAAMVTFQVVAAPAPAPAPASPSTNCFGVVDATVSSPPAEHITSSPPCRTPCVDVLV